MFEFLGDRELWVAVFSGGVLVKIIDYIFPALLNRKENAASFAHSEKEDLREDIDYLRNEIEELRKEVAELRLALKTKDIEVSKWQRMYWRKKLELEKVVWQVRHYGDQGIKGRVMDTLGQEDLDKEPSVDSQE